LIRATVFRSAQRVFDCKLSDSGKIVTATAKGNLLKGDDSVIVGDEVCLNKETNGEYFIEEVQERKSVIWRQIKRENKKKITASNIDLLVILASVSKPKYKRGIVDRFLIRSSQWDIPAILIFNKMDIFKEGSIDLSFEEKRLKELNVKSFEISTKFSDYSPQFLSAGWNELSSELEGKNSIFLGQSGVGKSSLISALSDGSVDLKTKNIGKAGKGTHTTTWSEMIDVDKFRMIDSPGIRSFSIDDILEVDFDCLFPDLVEYFVRCEFNNCNHEKLAKGCYFNTLVDGEEKDLVLSRLESYLKLRDEVSSTPDWQKDSI